MVRMPSFGEEGESSTRSSTGKENRRLEQDAEWRERILALSP